MIRVAVCSAPVHIVVAQDYLHEVVYRFQTYRATFQPPSERVAFVYGLYVITASGELLVVYIGKTDDIKGRMDRLGTSPLAAGQMRGGIRGAAWYAPKKISICTRTHKPEHWAGMVIAAILCRGHV